MGKIVFYFVDFFGFFVNCILMFYINEVIICFEFGVGDWDFIDVIMKNGINVFMGLFQLVDFIGFDICFVIMNVLYMEMGDSKYRLSVLLKNYVVVGWLGKKSGKGFYEYV